MSLNAKRAILTEAGSRIGGASFAQLARASGLTELDLRRLLKELNAAGLLAGRPLPDRKMAYTLTVLGSEFLSSGKSG